MSDTTASIAYLGPAGTYSDEAAHAFAARLGLENPQFEECVSFDDVFDCVDRAKCEYGVVAIENSLEGAVTATLDNFALASSACILGEHVMDIRHCLVTHPDARIEDITTIASHHQGLAQCRRYIAEHFPGRKLITTSSTAESARLAAADKHVAGIANGFAAELYGAMIAKEGIEDRFGNQTRFALIGRQGHPPVFEGERHKTFLALFMQVDKPGTLSMILSEFVYAGINLTMIQSRPTKQALGDYLFLVAFERSVYDPEVQTALNCLRLKLREVKVIGSYPI